TCATHLVDVQSRSLVLTPVLGAYIMAPHLLEHLGPLLQKVLGHLVVVLGVVDGGDQKRHPPVVGLVRTEPHMVVVTRDHYTGHPHAHSPGTRFLDLLLERLADQSGAGTTLPS